MGLKPKKFSEPTASTMCEFEKKKILCQPQTKPGKVALDVTIVIDGSGSVKSEGWAYSVKAANTMASSFGVGARVSAAVFSTGFQWLTKGAAPSRHEPCPDKLANCAQIAKNNWCDKRYSKYWKTNQEHCPKSCKTGKTCGVWDIFTSPEKAAAAVSRAKWPKGSTNTADALSQTLSHINVQNTAAAAAKVRQVARLAFI